MNNLTELEAQKQNLIEQLKLLTFQERAEIETLLKKYVPDFMNWYDKDLNHFNIKIGNFNIFQITELHEQLTNWNFNFDAYNLVYIKIRFDRIIK